MLRQTLYITACLAVALTGCASRPLTPATPWTDIANDSLSFFTCGTDPRGLKVCYVFDWGDGDTSTTGYLPSGTTGWCSREFADSAIRNIRVRSRNERGAESGWSPALTFRPSNPPQLTGTITGFRRWAPNRWYHASVRVNDPDGDSVAVKFVWGDVPESGWSAYVPSDSVVIDSCRWIPTGPHTVRVVLKDKGCMVSRPSVVETVNVSSMAVIWTTSGYRGYPGTPTLGSIDGEPVLYCENDDDFLDCYGLDGRLRWSAQMWRNTGFAASLNSDGSRLYLTDYDSGLACLDARSGQKQWCLKVDSAACTPTLGPNGGIYVLARDRLVRVHDSGDSAVIDWASSLEGSSPVRGGAVVGRNSATYVVVFDTSMHRTALVALDATGSVLWRDTTHMRWGGPPVIDSRDRILVADESGYLHCFNPDGTLAWSAPSPTQSILPGCTAVGQDDKVVVTDEEGTVMCYDSTGRIQWASTFTDAEGGTTPCITEDGTTIYYDAESDRVRGIGSYGQVLWAFDVSDSLHHSRRGARLDEGYELPSAVIGPNGDLYLANEGGLTCIAHGGLKLANTAWPTYNHDNAHSGWAGRQQR
jgi:hypothetical protein